MKGDFFIWCAGSDKELLSKCSNAERNKHIGYGTLVLVPALLAFISMSYALSTIGGIGNKPILYYLGGFLWSLIIFSFDRFIVSTHRRKKSNQEELNNPSFYLRFVFAFILGIVISHPLVMLYFDGSISDKIEANVVLEKKEIQKYFDIRIENVEGQIAYIDSIQLLKERERDMQATVVAKEIDGEVIKNASGELSTTGLYGKGPAAENKIKHLKQLQIDLDNFKKESLVLKATHLKEISLLKEEQKTKIEAFTVSSDYLRRELALSQLKEESDIVGITQWFLICLFILIDVLPVIFKTFAPFGLYDRILLDDSELVKELDNSSRRIYMQKTYEEINHFN
jgi:hypothetical protein